MCTVLLANADRFPSYRLVPALRAKVDVAGGTCSTRRVGNDLEVTIVAEHEAADQIADLVVDWYWRWRHSWS